VLVDIRSAMCSCSGHDVLIWTYSATMSRSGRHREPPPAWAGPTHLADSYSLRQARCTISELRR
jgi:hypothetical protein